MPISLRSVSFGSLRQHRWFRPAVRALAALIGVWLVAWLAVPPLAKGPLERMASEQLGRAVTIGGIDFKPWSLEFALRDVAVAGAHGGPAQLTIGRIYADGELQSLLRFAPVVDAFTIENPVLRITHLGDGRYDVDDILAKVAAPKKDPEPDQGPARLALYNLALTGGSIDFIDVTLICEAPKIGPHRDAIRARIAEILALAPDQVSFKATTTERLGFTGRGEGIAAHAIATVRLP